MTSLLAWLLPGGGIVLALLATLAWAPEDVVAEAGRGYPWVAFALTVTLSVAFHRTRPACLALLLAGSAWALSASDAVGAGATTATPAILGGTVALLVLVLALSTDRGVLAPMGLVQLGVTALVGGVGITAAAAPPALLTGLLAAPEHPSGITAWTGLPGGLSFLYAAALLAVAWVAVSRRGPVERGLPWFLVAVAMAFHGAEPGHALLWLMAASLVLAFSVVETSYAMAYRDDLTGLPGRRALMRDLDALGARYAVAMVDVDHFKKFNDRHGHDVGDQVLRMVGGRLARVGGGGRSYRYGGEEFTVLFPGRSREEALDHLEGLRRDIEEASFAVRGWRRPAAKPAKPAARKAPKRLSVTVSIGVADATGSGSTPEAVLKKADKALYRAKRGGRNRVAK